MTGRCQCGQVSYQIKRMPLTLYACHCTECQRQSSSAYGMSMPVPASGFSVHGELKYWQRDADDGNSVKCAFCSQCGTRLFHLPSRNAQIVNVKPGTLDDKKWLRPVGHLWVNSAQQGSVIPTLALTYAGQPESFDALYDAWLQRYSAADNE